MDRNWKGRSLAGPTALGRLSIGIWALNTAASEVLTGLTQKSQLCHSQLYFVPFFLSSSQHPTFLNTDTSTNLEFARKPQLIT